jgi:hypothetical protein
MQAIIPVLHATSSRHAAHPRSPRLSSTRQNPRNTGARTLFPQLRTSICQCGNSPLCRHHHRVKQADGWRLEQPEPGVLVWHTPAGRTYTTTPTEYAA